MYVHGRPTDGHGGAFRNIVPSSDYLYAAKTTSEETAHVKGLVVIGLDGVLGAKLPFHLSGGHTDFLSRTYLQTFIQYLMHPKTPWYTAFWTGSMTRDEALKTLRMLKHRFVGVWSKEDCRSGYHGGELTVKDLQVLWDELLEEQGWLWNQTNTLVITDRPEYSRAQPKNFCLAPSFHYKMSISFDDDQYLLMLIAVLDELNSQSNFSQYIDATGWDKEEFWYGIKPFQMQLRDQTVHNAIKICTKNHIAVKASGGN
ncbi:hypothetical protein MNV49_005801 [Pseudohyphozyma bogoriensis]|nr:hypothetical protein MNV49_005801 [Pseudohyphozyma bogoriensis]